MLCRIALWDCFRDAISSLIGCFKIAREPGFKLALKTAPYCISTQLHRRNLPPNLEMTRPQFLRRWMVLPTGKIPVQWIMQLVSSILIWWIALSNVSIAGDSRFAWVFQSINNLNLYFSSVRAILLLVLLSCRQFYRKSGSVY